MKKPKAIDLFCGCGGISAGLRDAGFEVLAGIDIEPTYLATFTHNFPSAKSLPLDISTLSAKEFMKLVGVRPGEVELLVGGPPCQGFSKNVPAKYRFLEDPRNCLVKSFLDYCEQIQPQAVIMENVAEMKNGFEQAYTGEILERLTEEGYTVRHDVLNAADYGVPQRRRRAFFVATRAGHHFAFPTPTHVKVPETSDLFAQQGWVTVWEAIGDLPSLHHGEGQEVCKYASQARSDYQALVRNKENRVANHVARKMQPTQFERLSSIEPGQGHKDLPKHLQTKGGYSGAYGRLTKGMVAPTITRWVFHPGSGRWGHPVDIRTLTIREVARIQGFSDSFEFVGSFTQRAGQLGNAVPPLLFKQLAESVLKTIHTSSLATNATKSAKLILCAAEG